MAYTDISLDSIMTIDQARIRHEFIVHYHPVGVLCFEIYVLNGITDKAGRINNAVEYNSENI